MPDHTTSRSGPVHAYKDDAIQTSAFVSCNDTCVSSFHDHYFQSPPADANDIEDGPLGDDIQFITIKQRPNLLNKKR